jgi:hypothetical protein
MRELTTRTWLTCISMLTHDYIAYSTWAFLYRRFSASMVCLPRYFGKRFRTHVHIQYVHPNILETLCNSLGGTYTVATAWQMRFVVDAGTCYMFPPCSISRQAVHMSTQFVNLKVSKIITARDSLLYICFSYLKRFKVCYLLDKT